MKKLLAVIVILNTLTNTDNLFAEKDPAAARLQAKIDADQADVDAEKIKRREEAAIGLDSVDAPEVITDDEKINKLEKEAEKKREEQED